MINSLEVFLENPHLPVAQVKDKIHFPLAIGHALLCTLSNSKTVVLACKQVDLLSLV